MGVFLNVLLTFAVVLIVIGAIATQVSDFRDWNYGTCKKSGQPWIAFSTDSSGAIGFKDDCNNTIWISYHTIWLAEKLQHLRK